MPDSSVRRRLAWLTGARAVVGTVLLGGAIVAQIAVSRLFSIDACFFLIALVYALTVVYSATLGLVDRRPWLIDLQLAGDALIVSGFIYVTGGITGSFSVLYVLPILAAGMLRFRRGSLLVAALSAVAYGSLVMAQYLGGSGFFPYSLPAADGATLPPRSVAEYTVALNAFGFVAVALLSGTLAERLESMGARLQQASTEIAGL